VLIAESCTRQNIQPQQLTIHADRGAAMIAKPLAALLADLGVSESHSRPHVSNDNPFSEAQFKTMKYQPTYPRRFGSQADARSWAQAFFPWYNFEHHHSGIGLMTPAAIHFGQAAQLWYHRQAVLQQAYAAHAQRFVKGLPQPPALPTAVWINPPKKDQPALPIFRPPAESTCAEPLPSAGAPSEGRGPRQERFTTQPSQNAGALLTG
jgi:putative transposase